MKIAPFLFILQFTFQVLLSQSGFREGYIVNYNHDTIKGFVRYGDKRTATEYCRFKVAEDQPIKEYSPKEIEGYGFVNDTYFAALNVSNDSLRPIRAFFEVLTEGRISLFRFDDRFYVQKFDTLMYELTGGQKEAIVDGKKVIYDSKRYLGYLVMLMADCEQIQPRIPDIELLERQLTELIEDYNRLMTGSVKSYKAKKKWTRLSFGTYAGGVFSALDLEIVGDHYEYLKGHFENSFSPVAGITLDISSPRISEKMSLHTGLSVNSSKYYSYSEYRYSDITLSRNFLTIKLTQLKLPLGIGISFPGKKYTPYFNLGIENIINLDGRAELHQEVETNNVVFPYTMEILEISKYQLGMSASARLARSFTNGLSGYLELSAGYSGRFASDPEQVIAIHSAKVTTIQFALGITLR